MEKDEEVTGKNNTLKIGIALLGFFLLGLGYSLYPSIKSGNFNPIQKISAKIEKDLEVHYMDIDPILTNLKKNGQDKHRYISIQLTLEVAGDDSLQLVTKEEPLLRDAVIDFLGKQTMAELILRDDEELETKDFLTKNIKMIINEVLETDEDVVQKVLVRDMLLQ